MDMTTEHTEDNPVLTQAAFEDLQKRLAKAEGKLTKAKTRAQATMQEIWQMDVKLKEEEDRANRAEALLAQADSAISPAQIAVTDTQTHDLQEKLAHLEEQLAQATSQRQDRPDPELAQARLDGLRISLHEAEERAREAEDKLGGLSSSATVFSDQLADIQNKVKEAEERALDWEERFHRSEERVLHVESAQSEDLSTEVDRLTQRVEELVGEVALWRTAAEANEGHPSQAEPDPRQVAELEEAAQVAQQRVADLEAEAREAERKVEDLENELKTSSEQVTALQEQLSSSSEIAGGGEGLSEDARAQLEERLALADERAELLTRKANQAVGKLEAFQHEVQGFEKERQEYKNRLTRSETLLAEAEERMQKQRAAAQEAPMVALSSGSTDERVQAVEARLQEALKRARESDMKAGQADLQLQKAMVSLKEYEQRANESDRETQRLAFQDSLTGLPNLNLIRQYLDFTVKQVQRYGRASALLVVDIDRFKLINDSMGMKAGDELLVKVAERLQTAIRESDALGRRGEDEFLILLSELFTGDDSVTSEQKTHMIRQNIAIVVNRISECLSRPFSIQGQNFYVRASIGVSICPNDAETSQTMLEHADSAMYHAKESGRGRCIFYNNELHKKQERRLAMDSQLRLAMEKGEFVLQYQPVIQVTKGKGQMVGVEALLRWNHRLDGMLAPASFLSIAEETGLIIQLGQWVCRQACWQLRQWLGQGASLFVAFNVSTRQMLQADLAEVILGSVEEFGLQPGLVFVEVAEAANVEEVDLVERVVATLGAAGIRVAIDDFGVGYSSLSRLDLQHIQFLKIDPSLIAGSQQDKAKANICEAAVRLAQTLEITPLAEGVETLAQAKYLAKIGCQYMQGFFLQEPCSAEEISRMLSENRVWKL